MRQCGGCTLCCKLMPIKEIGKKAGVRCQHQRTGKGCAVYHDAEAGFPVSCAVWACGWLSEPECADLSRPDRSHYVIDPSPDFVTLQRDDGATMELPVIQIWIDPKYPDAHRDPALRRFLESGPYLALIRINSRDGFTLFPPVMTGGLGWQEKHGASMGREHSIEEIANFAERHG